MRLSLRQLQIFLAVADGGSTTAAAERVALSQSATSAALIELESLLGTHLFDRIGKRLLMNDNGRVLLPQARQILDAASMIEQQFVPGMPASGAGLHIGASTTIGIYLLPDMLAAAYGRTGQTNPEVMIANTADIIAAVANFEIDLGLIEGPCHNADLHVEPWILDELIVVAAPAHPLAAESGCKVPLKALREAAWLLREPGSGTREAVEHALAPHLHVLRPGGQFSNSEAIKHAAAAGLGVACLSRSVVADFITSGRLVEVPTTLPVLRRNFFLIHSQRKILSQRLDAFRAFCLHWKPSTGCAPP